MEHHHEDNAHFENVAVHNTQNLLENLQFGNNQQGGEGVAFAGIGDQSEAMVVGSGLSGIGCVVDNAGCKFEEHIERGDGDDEELKYIKEKHQSEKQQQHNHYDLLKATLGNGDGPGPDDNGLLMHQMNEHHHLLVRNGGENNAENGSGGGIVVGGGGVDEAGYEEEIDIIKNDGGDISTTSNATTSTTQSPADDDKDIAADLLQVEMKIQSAPQQPGLDSLMGRHGVDGVVDIDEEEQSSLATNGTSSLSENQSKSHVTTHPHDFDIGELENACVGERPVELNFDHHSMLNPEAKEFVPSFGSNPASPTMISAPVEIDFGSMVVGAQRDSSRGVHSPPPPPHPKSNDVARHILGEQQRHNDDDFVAQSPHKERCVDMEAISVPGENEFEHEAARRPHELEKEELLLSETDNVSEKDLLMPENAGQDCQDFNRQSPASFIDHGPETSVDLESDIAVTAMSSMPMQPVDDVMKQSIYVENTTHNASDEQIEHLLNTVQPLPTDCESLNSSIQDEKEFIQQMNYEREMFKTEGMENVDENNLVSQIHVVSQEEEEKIAESPVECTEQQQQTCNVAGSESPLPLNQDLINVEERSFLMDATIPIDSKNVSLLDETEEASFEAVRTTAAHMENELFEEQTAAADDDVIPPQSLLIAENDDNAQDHFKNIDDNSNPTPSPHSTEEKHLIEETKESQQQQQQQQHQFMHDDDFGTLGEKMENMNLTSGFDGNLAQMEPADVIAAAINQNDNPFEMSENVNEIVEHQYQDELLHERHERAEREIESQPNTEKPPVVEIIQIEYFSATNEQMMMPPQHENEYSQQTIDTSATIADEAFVEKHEELKEEQKIVETVQEEPIVPIEPSVEAKETASATEPNKSAVIAGAAAVVGGVAAAAAAAAANKVATAGVKKPATTKSSTTTTTRTAKPTSADAKKPLVEVKRSTVTLNAKPAAPAARPRTAPVKKSTEKPATATASATNTSALAGAGAKPAAPAPRKTFTARPAPKTTSSSSSTTTTSALRANTAPKTASASTASRPASASARSTASSTTSTVRKTASSTTNSSIGVNSAKSRTNTTANGTSAPASKPSTLAVGANAKPKTMSPRATLTSQLRKTTAAKSPNKPTAPAVAGTGAGTNEHLTTKASGSTVASRAKATSSTTTTTATTASNTSSTTTKRFVARPAPKFNSTTSTAAATTGASAPSKTSLTSKKLSSSPSKTSNSTKLSPSKPSMTTAAGKSMKSKEAPVPKSPKDLKEQQQQPKAETKLAADDLVMKTNGTIEEPHLNGNGVHHHHDDADEHTTNDGILSPPEVINLIDD